MDQKEWNKKIKEFGGSFLQSWEWGDFQSSQGREVKRYMKDSMLVQAFKHKLPFKKSYYYIPHGPLGNFSEKGLIEILGDLGQDSNTIFLKAEPLELFDLPRFGFSESDKIIQPKRTLVLDLTKSEKDLFDGMRKNTRYSVRTAMKHGLVVEEKSAEEFKSIWPIFESTAERGDFRLHPFEYYKHLLEIDSDLKVKLFVSRHQNKYLSVGVFAFWNDTVYYLHGASSDEFRNLMGSYILQWEMITQTKRQGYRKYDFWGIDEVKWPGVTRFKVGFGGEEVKRLGAYDIPVSRMWYLAYRLSQKVMGLRRKIKR